MSKEIDGMIRIPEEVLALLRRHNMLKKLVKNQFLDQTLESVKISKEEEDALLSSYAKRNNLKNNQELTRNIKNYGLTMDDLAWQLQLSLRIKKYSLMHFESKAEQRFLERKNSLDQVIYSLLRVKNRYLARELYMQISESESDFAELAAQYSEGRESTTRGVLGPISLTQAHPILSERLRTTSPGTVMEPFQIDNWWLVARLERYLPANFDSAMRERMCRELFDQWIEEETTRRITLYETNDSAATPV